MRRDCSTTVPLWMPGRRLYGLYRALRFDLTYLQRSAFITSTTKIKEAGQGGRTNRQQTCKLKEVFHYHQSFVSTLPFASGDAETSFFLQWITAGFLLLNLPEKKHIIGAIGERML